MTSEEFDRLAPEADATTDEFDPSVPDPEPMDGDPFAEVQVTRLETKGIIRQLHVEVVKQQELWNAKANYKAAVAVKLRQVGRYDLADELDHCHSEVTYCECQGCRKTRIFRNRCDRLYCPECQPALTRRRLAGLAWWVAELKQPKMFTFTVKNTKTLTAGHVREFKTWFTRLRHRKICESWRGGIYSLEVTNEQRGFHLHLHALVDSDYIDKEELSQAWRQVTRGFGYIVDIRDARAKDYLAEVVKYAVKGSEIAAWKPHHIVQFIEAFTSQRTFGVFGNLYGKRAEWKQFREDAELDRRKCDCGCNFHKFYTPNEWIAHIEGVLETRPPPARPEADPDLQTVLKFFDAPR